MPEVASLIFLLLYVPLAFAAAWLLPPVARELRDWFTDRPRRHSLLPFYADFNERERP